MVGPLKITRQGWLGLSLLILVCSAAAGAPPPFLVLASTTSTEQSGLFTHLLPAFTATSGIQVRVVAVGSGQALDMVRRGDADAALVHDPPGEARLVAEGHGLARQPVMYNDFVLIGPHNDPAGVHGRDLARAMARLALAGSGFVSRGDRSGTHAAELRYWQLALPDGAAPRTAAYRDCGCGMGAALNMAAATGAYVLSDRGSWLNFRNRADLAVLVEGDPRMFNPYGLILVNPQRHAHVRHAQALAFSRWLLGSAGQAAIANYRVQGQAVFFPSAGQ